MAENPVIFDRALLRQRRRRAAALGPANFLLDRVADDLAERLTTVLRRFDLAVDLGTPGEAVRNALARLESVGRIVAADVMPDAARGEIFVAADEEALPSATPRSISWCRRWRCNSSTTCRACWCKSAAP